MNGFSCCLCTTRASLQFVQCSFCPQLYCTSCVTRFKLEVKNKCFECPYCDLLALNPASKIQEMLTPILVSFADRKQRTESLTLPIDCEKLEAAVEATAVEIRCLKLDSRSYTILGEQTFPDKCQLFFNSRNFPILNLDPISLKSSLKKRRDHIYNLSRASFLRTAKKNDNKMSIGVDLEHLYDGKHSLSEDIGKIAYVFGVFAVTELATVDQILASGVFRTLDEDGSKQFIKTLFGRETFQLKKLHNPSMPSAMEATEQQRTGNPRAPGRPEEGSSDMSIEVAEKDDIEVDELGLDVMCMFLLGKIQMPARGNKCRHINCFGLRAFLANFLNSAHKKFHCPICQLTIQHFVYDKLVEKVIARTEKIDKIGFKDLGQIELFMQREEIKKDRRKEKTTAVVALDDSEPESGPISYGGGVSGLESPALTIEQPPTPMPIEPPQPEPPKEPELPIAAIREALQPENLELILSRLLQLCLERGKALRQQQQRLINQFLD